MTQKTNPWTMDVRVRERNLKSGALTDKDVEKYLGTLPDLADQADPFATSQPTLAEHVHSHAAPEPVAMSDDAVDSSDSDEVDDEDGASDFDFNGEGGTCPLQTSQPRRMPRGIRFLPSTSRRSFCRSVIRHSCISVRRPIPRPTRLKPIFPWPNRTSICWGFSTRRQKGT